MVLPFDEWMGGEFVSVKEGQGETWMCSVWKMMCVLEVLLE